MPERRTFTFLLSLDELVAISNALEFSKRDLGGIPDQEYDALIEAMEDEIYRWE